jgi:sugar lactone lactonase YvrE
MIASAPICVWPVGAELGEGPVWHAEEQAFYFVDIKGRAIHRCDAGGGRQRSWATPRSPGFVLPCDDGGLLCGMQGGLHRFDPDTGSFTLLQPIEEDLPGNRINDGFADHRGRLWFGTMDDAEKSPSGALYLRDRANLREQDRNYIITNGPAMSPDGKTLYHTDTLLRTVYAFDVDAAGNLSGKRPFIVIDGSGYPDGLAVDAEGCLWIALFGGWRIERFLPSGELAGVLPFPCANITKLAFGGSDLQTVQVTTAWKGLSPAERSLQPLAGGLFSFRADTPGLAQHYISTEVQK